MSQSKRQLYSAAFLMEICYGLFLLIAALKAARLISSPMVIGLAGTLHMVTRVIGNYFFGGLSDRIGRKWLMLFACALTILGFLILGMDGIFYIFLAYFVSGVGNSIFWPVIEAWIGHGTRNENLLRLLGIFGLAFTGGVAIGNLSGGFFVKIGPMVSILFGTLTILIISWLIWRARDGESAETASPEIRSGPSPSETVPAMTKTVFLYISWVANFATWTAIGINRFLFPKLGVVLGIDSALIGSINAVLYGCWFLMFLTLIHVQRWLYRLPPLIAFQFGGILALLSMGLWPSQTTFFIAFGLFGFSAAMTYLSSMFYGQNATEERGHRSGLHEMILGLGMLLGPFCGGLVAEFFSLQAPFFFSALIVAAAIILEIIMLRNWRLSHRNQN